MKAREQIFSIDGSEQLSMNKVILGIRSRLLASQVVGQVAPIAVTPLLTRLISPEQMGDYQIALSVALVSMPFALLQTDIFLPLARDAKEAGSLLHRASLATLAVGAMAAVAAAAMTGFNRPEPAFTSFMLVAAMSLLALTNASLIRKEDLATLAKRNTLGGGMVALIQIACTAIYPSVISLGVGMLSGRILCHVLIRSSKNYAHHPHGNGAPPGLWPIIHGASANVLGSFASQMPMLVVAPAYGAAAAGHLGLGQRVVGAPTTLIGQGVNQIIVAEASAILRSREGVLWIGVRRQFAILLGMSLFAAMSIAIFAPPLTPWIFGQAWAAAGKYIQILALPMCLQFVAIPMISIMAMLGRQRMLLLLQVGRILGVLICIMVGNSLSLEMPKTIGLISAVWTAAYAATVALAIMAMRKHDRAETGSKQSCAVTKYERATECKAGL